MTMPKREELKEVDKALKCPRTCARCRAYQNIGFSTSEHADGSCMLGYKIERGEIHAWNNWTEWEDISINSRPAERCPKPLTIAAHVYWRGQVDIHRNNMPDPDDIIMDDKQSLEHYVTYKK